MTLNLPRFRSQNLRQTYQSSRTKHSNWTLSFLTPPIVGGERLVQINIFAQIELSHSFRNADFDRYLLVMRRTYELSWRNSTMLLEGTDGQSWGFLSQLVSRDFSVTADMLNILMLLYIVVCQWKHTMHILTKRRNHVDERCALAHCLLATLSASGSGLRWNVTTAFISYVINIDFRSDHGTALHTVELAVSLVWVAQWHSSKVLDLRSIGRGFNSHPDKECVTTLDNFFTPMCLCYHAV